MPQWIDLNSDIGELIDGYDEQILSLVTSGNISCGVHAGSAALTRKTIELAFARGVAIGAHPGLAGGYGRSTEHIAAGDTYDAIAYQLDGFLQTAADVGASVTHVKPHGTLYNQAETDPKIADAIVRAIKNVGSDLAVYGLAGGKLVAAASSAGLAAVDEFFADRSYRADGTLMPRTLPGAVISDAAAVKERTVTAVVGGAVVAVDGTILHFPIKSVCVHGDTLHAVQRIEDIRQSFTAAGIGVRKAV